MCRGAPFTEEGVYQCVYMVVGLGEWWWWGKVGGGCRGGARWVVVVVRAGCR